MSSNRTHPCVFLVLCAKMVSVLLLMEYVAHGVKVYVVISELMASYKDSLLITFDGGGTTSPDWVELHNQGDNPVSLEVRQFEKHQDCSCTSKVGYCFNWQRLEPDFL
jgi:hypothetical protein